MDKRNIISDDKTIICEREKADRVPASTADNGNGTATGNGVKQTGSARRAPNRNWTDCARRTVPSTNWLFRNYRWTEDFAADAMAGLMVAVLNVPQGMAYSIMANVEPTVGLYMAIVPALVYSLLGTSRHVSVGVLSVVCLLTGKAVAAHAAVPDGCTAIQVATAVTLVTGLVQLLMCACRMGMMCTVLSETFVNAFTASVAVVVCTSQLKELLGLDMGGPPGTMQMPRVLYEYAVRLHTANWTTAALSAATVTTMLLYNYRWKQKVNKALPIPIPIELLMTIFGAFVFGFTDIAVRYNMAQMGEIKSGMPDFAIPPLNLLPAVFLDGCVIALITYSITMSLAMELSQRLRYPLDANQELFAQGMSNVVGSLFQCLPCGGSPSRSACQQSIGGKTQMASIVAAAAVTVVLLWIGPVFEPLPRCVLASIVVVALSDIMVRIVDVAAVWRRSRSDGVIWTSTFASVLVLGVDGGMLIGVGVSLVSVFVRGVANEVYVLGRLPDTGHYVRFDTHADAAEIPGVKVLRYTGSLNVINRHVFKSKVMAIVRADRDGDEAPVRVIVQRTDDGRASPEPDTPCLVLDMAALHYVDSEGGKVMCELIDSLVADGYEICLTAMSAALSEHVRRGNRLESVRSFPTIHDAVEMLRGGEKRRQLNDFSMEN